MLAKEMERLRGINIRSIVVALGVFPVTVTLAEELAAGRVSGCSAIWIEERRAARIALHIVRDSENIRGKRCVGQVVVSERERGIDQPTRAQRSVIPNHKIAGAVLQLVEGGFRRGDQSIVTVGGLISVGGITENRPFDLVIVVDLEGYFASVRVHLDGDADIAKEILRGSSARDGTCVRRITELSELIVVGIPLRVERTKEEEMILHAGNVATDLGIYVVLALMKNLALQIETLVLRPGREVIAE